MTAAEFLQIADDVISVAVLLGGAIAFIGRAWIKDWIGAHFTKAVNKELEEQKHQLNKELEAYRGSVMRELEEFRANVDIRRSIALKTADARLDALRSLYADYFVAIRAMCSHVKMNPQLRLMHHPELMDALNKYNDSERLANIFVPPEVALPLANSLAELLNLANGPQLQDNVPAYNQPLERAILAGNAIKGVIDQPITAL